MKNMNVFRNTTGILPCNFNHFLSVKGWKDVLLASTDYTIRFSAISSNVVVSDWKKDHEIIEDPNKGFSPVSFP